MEETPQIPVSDGREEFAAKKKEALSTAGLEPVPQELQDAKPFFSPDETGEKNVHRPDALNG